MSKLKLSNSFLPDEFLQKNWQKKPVLIKGLVSNLSALVSADELAGLACEPAVESRVVTNDAGQFNLQHGPFDESFFGSLPASNCSLLVQAVDQWIDSVAELRELFDFIPRWRVEDVMVSFAESGGGVGPHFDNYDVFLIQGQGQRTWRLGQRCSTDTPLSDSSGQRLLASFESHEEYVLTTGDALYIPPRVAHWGTADSASVCYSVGFRAPSYAHIVENFSNLLIDNFSEDDRYSDPDLAPTSSSARIDTQSLDRLFQDMLPALSDRRLFIRAIGHGATQSRYPDQLELPEPSMDLQSLVAFAESGTIIRHHPTSRFAYVFDEAQHELWVFVDGQSHDMSAADVEVISELCNSTTISTELFASCLASKSLSDFILLLLNQGSLYSD